MDRLEAAMNRIGYEWERGVEKGDQVRIRMKAMPFWWVIIGWLVRQARRGVMVCVVERVETVGEGGTIILSHLKTYSSQMENEGQQGWITQRVCMDGLEAAMDRIGYEQERGVERGPGKELDRSDALLVGNNWVASKKGKERGHGMCR